MTGRDFPVVESVVESVVTVSAPCDPVGVADIAERLGVSKITVHKWTERGTDDFPKARWKRSGVSLWNQPTVEAWARRTGRLSS